MTEKRRQIETALSELSSELSLLVPSTAKEARLIAVSKTHPIEDIQIAYAAGQRDFGENKVQELREKSETLAAQCPEIRWHFIGKLQTNKVNMLLKVPNLVSIHSIDSIKLLNKLLAKNPDRKIGLFLQYNTSGEGAKGGFEDFSELAEAAKALEESEYCYLQGLMTMGAIRTDNFEKAAKECFDALRGLKERLEGETSAANLELSMGMSGDYPIALKAGADWVRVGSKIFGSRQTRP